MVTKMALSSNETAWAVMTITLIISAGYGTLLTWITIKAQHAKNIEELKEYVKNIFVRLFIWLSNLFAFLVLLLELFSVSPINRRDVFLIVWSVTILFSSLMFKLLIIINKFFDIYTCHIEKDRLVLRCIYCLTEKCRDKRPPLDKTANES